MCVRERLHVSAFVGACVCALAGTGGREGAHVNVCA